MALLFLAGNCRASQFPDVCSKRVHRQTLARVSSGGGGGKERGRERIFQRRWQWIDGIYPLLKNEMAAIRSVSRGFASIGRAGSTKIMVMATVPVIEWNNCFHLFESRMERVVGGELIDCKRNLLWLVLMDVSYRWLLGNWKR